MLAARLVGVGEGEGMKLLKGNPFDKWRDTSQAIRARFGSVGDETCGFFWMPISSAVHLKIIASAGGGWDHVSVSLPNRCPTWDEMKLVKEAFFRDDEWAYELHAPPTENISIHPFCLHLWRSHFEVIPLPPTIMVGPSISEAKSSEHKTANLGPGCV